MSRNALFCASLCVLLLISCTPAPPTQEKVPCHPASGSLSIGNKPAKGATIIFVPKNEPADAKVPRPRANVEDDGSFKIATYDVADGAPVGEYGMIIHWPGNEKDDQLDGRYSTPQKSAITIKIAEGSNNIPPLKLR